MNSGPLTYLSGEEIAPGDHVRYDGLTAEIEFVIDPRGTPEDRAAEQYGWYMETYGGGMMLLESEVFGRLFLDLADMTTGWCSSNGGQIPKRRLSGSGGSAARASEPVSPAAPRGANAC